jgi:hypothetical protein
MLDKEIRTILIDEADRALDQKKEGIADTLAVINSGYKRGGTHPVGWRRLLRPGPLRPRVRAFTGLTPTRYVEVRRRFMREHPGHAD